MVQSRPHHLRHQWSQISTFVSLNHLRHHTYSKSSYVHIQVFHILHHHTMKLLLGIKSFLPRRPIVEIDSENWFAVDFSIRQWKLFRCLRHNFSSEDWFAAANTVSAANHNFAAEHTIRQRMLIRCRNSVAAANRKFAANHSTSAANHNFAAEHTIRQRMLIRCRNSVLAVNHKFATDNSTSAMNANSLQTTQFRQRITISLQNTQFGSEC